MSGALRLALAQARRRRVQSVVVALAAMLAATTGVLALSLRTLTDGPYDRAFEAQAGAHLVVAFAPDRVTAAQLRGTASLSRVAAAAGPWSQVSIAMESGSGTAASTPGCAPGAAPAGRGSSGGGGKGAPGSPSGCDVRHFDNTLVVGRDTPGGPVDRLDVVSGHWPTAPGQIAVRQLLADAAGLAVGDHLTALTATAAAGATGATQTTSRTPLTVTAIVAGVDRSVSAWVLPGAVAQLASAKAPPDLRMEYRLRDASTSSAVDAARAQVVAALPPRAVEGATSWLDVKRSQDLTIEVMAPFLLAFSVLGIGAVFLIVVNVVGGAVVAGRRDIGVMKAIGFTPGGVSAVLVTAMLLPALAGTLAGLPLGVLASQPLLAKASEGFGLPYHPAVSPLSLLLVAAAMIGTVALATAIPAWRAGRVSAAEALSSGLAPRSGAAAWLWRRIAALPLPRPLALGAADSVVRPARSAVTLVAIVAGVSSVVFAIGLTGSLALVKDTAAGPANAQVAGSIAPVGDTAQSLAAVRAVPGVARLAAAHEYRGSIAGVTDTVRVDAWQDDASWLGYDVFAGHWLSGPDQVVITSQLQRSLGLQVGDRLALQLDATTLHPTIAGILFTAGDTSTVHIDARSIDLSAQRQTPTTDPPPLLFDVGVASGADPRSVAESIRTMPTASALVRGDNVDSTAFAIIESVLISLTLIVTAVAALGVFNTVVLSTRERQRHLAILKAVGMEPRQVITMVVTATVLLGIVAGAAAIPTGMALHRSILGAMADIAGTGIPPSLYGVYPLAVLPLLALTGAVIAVLGAVLPARWTARQPVSEVLRAE
jgi:putative ABC transport system permease protein